MFIAECQFQGGARRPFSSPYAVLFPPVFAAPLADVAWLHAPPFASPIRSTVLTEGFFSTGVDGTLREFHYARRYSASICAFSGLSFAGAAALKNVVLGGINCHLNYGEGYLRTVCKQHVRYRHSEVEALAR